MSTATTVGWTSAHMAAKHPIAACCCACAAACFAYFGGKDSRMVAITFDDGYKSNIVMAAPVLERNNMVATAFVNTSSIEEEKESYMDWIQVKQLHTKGWQVASHGADHFYLTKEDDGSLDYQLRTSKEILEANGMKQTSFASPYGDFDDRVIKSASNYYDIHVNAWSEMKGITTRHDVDPMNIHRQDVTSKIPADEVCSKVRTLGDNTLYSIIFHDIVSDEVYKSDYENTEDIWTTPLSKFEEIVSCIKKSGIDTVTIEEGVWYLLEGKAELNKNPMEMPDSLRSK